MFLSFYDNVDMDKVNEFLYLILKSPKVITLRPFSNYIIRYLFTENYLDNMILWLLFLNLRGIYK